MKDLQKNFKTTIDKFYLKEIIENNYDNLNNT